MYSPYGSGHVLVGAMALDAAVLHAQRSTSFPGEDGAPVESEVGLPNDARLRQTSGHRPVRRKTPQTRQPAFEESFMIPLEGFALAGFAYSSGIGPVLAVLCLRDEHGLCVAPRRRPSCVMLASVQ